MHSVIRYDQHVVAFVVGIIVGASAAALLMIVIGPSRKVRAEPPLPPDVAAKILLGQDPEQPTIPPPPRVDHPRQYSPNELAALQKLGDEQAAAARRSKRRPTNPSCRRTRRRPPVPLPRTIRFMRPGSRRYP